MKSNHSLSPLRMQTREVAELLEMESWQIQSYAKQGFVHSSSQRRGAGSRRVYDEINLLKLAMLKQLSDDGFDIRTIRDIFSGLFDFPLDESISIGPQIRDWFEGKVLLTANRFRMRKLVRQDRLEQMVRELREGQLGLYIIDMDAITKRIFSNHAVQDVS